MRSDTVATLWRAGRDGRTPLAIRAVYVALILCALAGGLYEAFARIDYHWNWRAVWTYRARFVGGWLTTLALSAVSLALSSALGLAAALARRSRIHALREAATLYVEFIRGTPFLVQILVFFYVVANAFGVRDRFVAGVVILSVFAGAYLCEIIRAGIDSIGASQWESARAIGLTTAQTYRYVVLPQAIRHMLPPLAGQFVSLVKDSSLLSVIAVNEFAMSAQQVNSATYSTLECYLPLAAGYLLVTLPLSAFSRYLERLLHFEH